MSSEYLITDSEVAEVHVEAEDTIVSGTPAENKAMFDEYPDLLKTKLNAFITYAESSYAQSLAISKQVGKQIYPVGTVLRSTVDVDPSTYLDFGTWVKLGTFDISVKRTGEDLAVKQLYFYERFE